MISLTKLKQKQKTTTSAFQKPADKCTRNICQNNSITFQAEKKMSLEEGQFIDCDKLTLKISKAERPKEHFK